MGILGSVLGELVKPVTDIIDKAVVDKDKKKELEFEMAKLVDEADKRFSDQMIAQIEVNKIEAAHPSVFVAGWRPFIGWVGGVSFAYAFLLSPFINQFSKWLGYSGEIVVLDTATLMVLVTGMLGMGTLRSFDKHKDTDTNRVGKL